MEYKVTINEVTYNLPRRTIEISKKVEELSAIMNDTNISVENRVLAMYEFVAYVLGIGKTKSILGSNMSKIDTNELYIIAQSIIDVYNSPIRRYDAQKKAEDLARSPLGKLMAQKNA